MGINKHFISEIDKQLAEFDQTHPLNAQRAAEKAKYQRIYQLRDVPTETEVHRDTLWD